MSKTMRFRERIAHVEHLYEMECRRVVAELATRGAMSLGDATRLVCGGEWRGFSYHTVRKRLEGLNGTVWGDRVYVTVSWWRGQRIIDASDLTKLL